MTTFFVEELAHQHYAELRALAAASGTHRRGRILGALRSLAPRIERRPAVTPCPAC